MAENVPPKQDLQAAQTAALGFFQSQGWSKEQSAGIVGNLLAESALDPKAFNPAGGGQGAKGVAQWRGPRLKDFEAFAGKAIEASTLDDQLKFVHHEMTEGKERRAGDLLKAAKTAAEAADVVVRHYERPGNLDHESAQRSKRAMGLLGLTAPVSSVTEQPAAAGPVGTVETSDGFVQRVQAGAIAAVGVRNTELADVEPGRAAARAAQDAAIKAQAEREGTSVGDVVEAALQHPAYQPTLAVLRAIENKDEDQKVPADWDNGAQITALEEKHYRDPRAVDFIRENVRGPESYRRVEAELVVRSELDATIGRAAPTTALIGTLLGGMADPGSMLAGVGIMKAAQVARIGSGAFIAQGRGGAALASAAAENVVGNLLVEGAADLSGEVYSGADYAVSAATALGFTGVFARGVTRAAAEVNLKNLADKIAADNLAAHSNLVGRAKTELPDDASTSQVQAKVDELQGRDNAERERAIATGLGDDEKLVPPEVTQQLRDELEGNETPPKPPGDEELDPTAPPPPPPPTNNTETGDALAGLDTGEQSKPVVRLIETDDGENTTVAWTIRKGATGGDATVSDALDILADPTFGSKLEAGERAIAERLRKTVGAWQNSIAIKFDMTKGRSYFAPPGSVKEGGGLNVNPKVQMRLGDKPGELKAQDSRGLRRMPLTELTSKLNQRATLTLFHEVVHAVTHAQIEAVKRGVIQDGPAKEAVTALEVLRKKLAVEVVAKPSPGGKNWGANYAAKNLHEFVAQVASDADTRTRLAEIDVGGGRSALSQFVKTVTKMLGFDKPTRTALDEALLQFDKLVKAGKDLGGDLRYSPGDVIHMAPDIPGILPAPASVNPDRAASARARWVPLMYERAKAILARNPIDQERTNVLTKYAEGGFSDGLVLAKSKNSILQTLPVLMVETTTGAGGRRATVAIDRELKFSQFIGNAVQIGEQAYNGWVRSVKGEGLMSQMVNDIFKGDVRRQFNDLVADEIRGRAYGSAPTTDRFVLEAANALGEGFERMRVAQVEAGTLGSVNLNDLDGRKYLPQNLEGNKLAVLGQDQLDQLSDMLATQLKVIVPEWDDKFRNAFSAHYLKRAKDRAMQGAGDRNAMQATDGLADIRTALDDMGGAPDDIKKAKQALNTRSGLSQTKHRINWNLEADLPWGGKLRDLFTNDPFQLYRSYANRTAGNVALTRAGILGEKGLIEMREAVQAAPAGQQATQQELDAFDRVAAEILGRPVPGAVISDVPNAMRLIVSLQRLGGMAITQFAETSNAIHHLGFTATLKAVTDLPRHIGNVGRVKRGGPANDLLSSIEFIGGKEFGMDSYKLVAPLDPPDDRLMVYGDQQGWFMKSLGAGNHLQAKLGFFRGVMAAQQRAMAEQTLIKALKYIDAGETGSVSLRDAGFTDELVARIRPFMDQIRTKDASGDLLSVDLTKLPDTRAAEQFVQAIWRMNGQIIQGTFIGERSKWFHNDYMKMFLQLRTFGLTAQEKQFGRNRLNHGYAKAAGIIAAQITIGSVIHLARVQANASLRGDREKYLKDQASVGALVKAGMNYSSATGLFGEAYQYAVALGGNYIDDENVRRQLGVQGQSTSVGGLIPASGSIDSAIKVASGRSNAYQAAKQLPFSNLWFVSPFLGALKQE